MLIVSALLSNYWRMVAEWRAIFAQPLSDEEKREACLCVLRIYIGRKAISRFRQMNPMLRFYADMVLLRSDLFPTFARDDFGELVIRPIYRLVDDWVRANSEPGVRSPVQR